MDFRSVSARASGLRSDRSESNDRTVSHFLSPLVSSPDQPWGVRDITSGRVVVSRLEAAFDSATRKKGLLGRDRLEPGTGLVIAPCGGIHTCFMRFPIDVLFLARDGRVVKVCGAVKPWRLALAVTAFCVIEVPANAAADAGTRAGNRVELFSSPQS
jgi:uncharacterized membrane protein (UPF0127 family)